MTLSSHIIGSRGRETDFQTIDPGEAILKMGRPTLVVPEEARTLRAEHVVLGWKDTREARRALRDALPFLQRATRVTIVEARGEGEETILANHDEISTACLPREHIGDPTAYCGRWNGLGQSDRSGHQIMQATLAEYTITAA